MSQILILGFNAKFVANGKTIFMIMIVVVGIKLYPNFETRSYYFAIESN